MKSNKRILIALHRFAVGGAETQALYLAEYLQENGYEVIVGAFGSEEGAGLQRLKRAGIDTIHWGFQEKLILNPEKGLIGKVRKYCFRLKLLREIRRLEIDTIIPFTYPANVIFCNWYKKMNVRKCFWNQRDMGIGFKINKIEKTGIAYSSSVLSNSMGGVNFLKNFTDRNIELIYNGVKLAQNDLDKPEKKFRVVMIGNIHGHKNHISILEAWKKVAEKNEKAQLLLVGEKSNTYSSCASFVESNGLTDSVHFLGLVEEVEKILESSSIAVFSSNWEGFPNGILEPMGHGLPVITFESPWALEALGEDYPLLIPAGNINMFAEVLLSTLDDRDLRLKIGLENKRRVKQNFSIQKMGESYINLIECD